MHARCGQGLRRAACPRRFRARVPDARSCKACEQRFCSFQIRCIVAFGERTVNARYRRTCFVAAVLPAKPTRKAYGCAQFKRLLASLLREVDRSLEACIDFAGGGGALLSGAIRLFSPGFLPPHGISTLGAEHPPPPAS